MCIRNKVRIVTKIQGDISFRHVDCSVKLKACLLEGIGGTWKIFQSLQASFYICDGFNSD
jgi:hypothetical protein